MTKWESDVLEIAKLYDADADRIERALHALAREDAAKAGSTVPAKEE